MIRFLNQARASALQTTSPSHLNRTRHDDNARRAGDGTGATIRSEHHVTALNKAALAAFTTAKPHRRKQRIPPGPAARHAAQVLRGATTTPDPVVDLTVYAAAAARRRNLP